MDFYLTLPSNTGDYPTNTIGSFQVKLPHRVDLDGDWEVALVELAYPVTWFNISSDEEALIELSFRQPGEYLQKWVNFNNYQNIDELCDAVNYTLDTMQNIDGERANFYVKYDRTRNRVGLKPTSRGSSSNIEFVRLSKKLQYMLGFRSQDLNLTYGKIEVLFKGKNDFVSGIIELDSIDVSSNESVNRSLKTLSEATRAIINHDKTSNCHFQYNIAKQEMQLVCKDGEKPNVTRIRLSESLQGILGLTDNIIVPYSRIKLRRMVQKPMHYVTAEDAPDMRAGQYSMFVYCNIVQPQIVGNMLTPMLRTVSIKGNYGEIVDQLYDNPHYIPVLKKEFSLIEINISDDAGQPVNFQYGKLFVKLHFRLKQ